MTDGRFYPEMATSGNRGDVGVTVGLNAIVVAVTGDVPRILTVRRPLEIADHPLDSNEAETAPEHSGDGALGGREGVPFGPLDPVADRTLELGLRRWLAEQTGIEVGYLEQLYTFGDRGRVAPVGNRFLSVAYLALTREVEVSGSGAPIWAPWYSYLPWEDWRDGPPAILGKHIFPALQDWIASASTDRSWAQRHERAQIAFGLGGTPWNRNRVLDRYELLFEIGLVAEAVPGTDSASTHGVEIGRPMALDHRRIVATALERLRGKLSYRPVAFELLPGTFTLLRLQQVVEALSGERLHKQNFRRLVEQNRLVERTGDIEVRTGGRPAELFRFRREVLRERPAIGVVIQRGRLATETHNG